MSIIELQKVDNLLPTGFQNFLDRELENMNAWLYLDSASGIKDAYDPNDRNIVDSPQFTHMIFDPELGVTSPLFEYVKPILWFLEDRTGYKAVELGRIKANLLLPTNTKSNNYNPPHIDSGNKDYTSMVYYVNDSDGDTRIFNNHVEENYYDLKMIESNPPKKGSAILFPSTRFHCSSNPINSKKRIILNFVFRLTL